jgi:hypothetical protein
LRLTWTASTALLLLWGVFFLELKVLLALGILLSVALILTSLAQQHRLDKIGVLVLANMLFWLASGFSVGAISLSSFVNPRFYEGDGRVFIALIPLLLFCITPVSIWEFKRIQKHILFISVSSILIYLFWLITHTPLLSGTGHLDEFHGFLTSHTGSGTFFGTFAAFMVAYAAEKRKPWLLVMSCLLLGPVFSSGSREAMLGVAAVLAWYWGLKRKHVKPLIAVAVLVLVALPFTSKMDNKSYNRNIAIFNAEQVEAVIRQTQAGIRSDWVMGDWTASSNNENLESGDVTSLVRIMLWVYATKRLIESPVFGMGWGRFNDLYLVMSNTRLSSLAVGGQQVFSAASAHNSYFQLLAETGLIGFGLYFSVWIWIYLRSLKAEKLFKHIQSVRAYYVGCQALVVYILVCALTGHALASPSVMLPVVTILGVGLAFYRSSLKVSSPNSKTQTREET